MLATARAALLMLTAASLGVTSSTRPHIVYYLVDDLGYANVGFHNDEPLTPNIDALAASGILLESFYTYKYCSPTRSSFMSGRLPIHVNQQNHPPSYPGGGVPLGMTTIADKLTSVGYSCHQIGKWHCGMSGIDRLPVHRGFSSSFGYLSGAEDHYTQTRDGYVDFWRSTVTVVHYVIRPLFIYMAYQNVHGPTQVPENYTDIYKSKHVDYTPRLLCLGMIAAVDESIGISLQALKDRGLYNNALIIFTSDNGGPHDHANNYPLRGSKGADFEGGVRVAAFIAGGILPDGVRGTKKYGLMHICDWYATFAEVAGYAVDDPKAAAAGLPAIDSVNQWHFLLGGNLVTTSNRTALCLSSMVDADNATSGGGGGTGTILIIDGTKWKLVRGNQGTSFFPGVHMPISTHDGSDSAITIPGVGMLFNLTADPIEHVDLSGVSAYAKVLRTISALAEACDGSYYQSDGRDANDKNAAAAAISKYGGFWGPWLAPGPVPVPPPPPSPAPPNPNPPQAGVFYTNSLNPALCLAHENIPSVSEQPVAVLGKCDSTSKWAHDEDGAIYSVDLNNSAAVSGGVAKKYIRHKPPKGTCAVGVADIIGIRTSEIYTTFDATGMLKSANCPDMCVGATEVGGVVALVKCSDATAKGWAQATGLQ